MGNLPLRRLRAVDLATLARVFHYTHPSTLFLTPIPHGLQRSIYTACRGERARTGYSPDAIRVPSTPARVAEE